MQVEFGEGRQLMGYVSHIECWQTGERVDPLSAPDYQSGDFAEVRYDLEAIRREVDRDALSRGPATMWRYSDLLPLADPAMAVTLGEGWTPLLPAPNLGREIGVRDLYLKDEGQNPSGTFKDRGASMSVSRLKELGVSTVVHNSSGNAGGSWGLYAARAGLRCVNLLPADVLPASLIQSELSGAETFVLDGDWKDAGAIVATSVERNGWFDVRTLKEPYRLEGKKTMGYEIAEQLGWTLPDAIVYPTGGGIGAIAIYKGLRELQQLGWVAPGPLPKLIVTQFEGCAPIVRAFENDADAAVLWEDLDVPPGGLKSVRPPGDKKVLQLIRETKGIAVSVGTDEAIGMVGMVTRLEGVFPCPESGTAVAGLKTALARGTVLPDERVVIMCTGSGLKSIPVLPRGNAIRVEFGDVLT